MVGGLAALVEDLDRAARELGGLAEHVGKQARSTSPEHEQVASTPSGSRTSSAARLRRR